MLFDCVSASSLAWGHRHVVDVMPLIGDNKHGSHRQSRSFTANAGHMTFHQTMSHSEESWLFDQQFQQSVL